MALDSIILDGDPIFFEPLFGGANVTIPPTTIKGSGKAQIKGKKVCLVTDATKVEVSNCTYTLPGCVAPGMGTVSIVSVAPNHFARKSFDAGKPLLLKGGNFIALFEPKTKAKIPGAPNPIDDPVPMYPGKGNFPTTNLTHKGS